MDADFSNLKIAVDFGNGASYKIARKLFEELGMEVISLNTAPDGKNINLNCGSTNMEVIRKAVERMLPKNKLGSQMIGRLKVMLIWDFLLMEMLIDV